MSQPRHQPAAAAPRRDPGHLPHARAEGPEPSPSPANVEAAVAPLPDLSLGVPPYIKDRYRTLALLSHPRHLEELDLGDGEILVVSVDWLLWRRSAERRMPVLHFETGLLDREEATAPRTDAFRTASEWVDLDGRDGTRFRGVSLGKQFAYEVARAFLAAHRLRVALGWFCRTFRPQRIVLFDYRTEDFDLGDRTKRVLVGQIAAEHGAAVEDRLGAGRTVEDWRPPTLGRVGDENQGPRDILRDLYAAAVEALSRLRFLGQSKGAKKILLFPVGAMRDGLMNSFDRARVRPLLPAERMPKTPGFVTACLRRGIMLARLGRPRRLSGRERRALGDIAARFDTAWAAAADGLQRVIREYARSEIVAGGRLVDMARRVKAADAFFRRHPGLHRIMGSGCALVPETRIYVEIARTLGIPCDELLHGMRLSRFPYDTLCGDRFGPPLLTRLLAWGPQNQEWLKAIGAPIDSVCTGHPAYARFPRPAAIPAGRDARVLFLPTMTLDEDYPVLTADCHADMVHTLKFLAQLGYRHIVTKLHPGTPDVAGYRRIFEHFGLPGRLATGGNFPAYVEWADLVIGPVWSSALVETVAAGKPYLPVLLPRSIADPQLVRHFRLIRTLADLAAALEAREPPDTAAVLEAHFSHPRIADPAARLWQVLAEDTGASAPATAPVNPGP